MELEISAAKVKPDGLYKTLIKRRIFDDSDEIENRLPLLNYLNILEYPVAIFP